MIPLLYSGSVKNVLGPLPGTTDVLFDYTDSFSVFDWGKMPDELPGKGAALAVLACHFSEIIESRVSWGKFAQSPECERLRAANPFGVELERAGAEVFTQGLRTHYLGATENGNRLAELKAPFNQMRVKGVKVVRPKSDPSRGYDYSEVIQAKGLRLVPLEVVFRFGCPPGSSLLARIEQDPQYLAKRGFGKFVVTAESRWDFPVTEFFTKLEQTDRPVTPTEAEEMTGLTPAQLLRLSCQTAWVASLLKSVLNKHGLDLADGKLEWAVDDDGNFTLIDAIGPDELRILKNGIQLSKEFLRSRYKASNWYAEVAREKEKSVIDWKSRVQAKPPKLKAEEVFAGSMIYQTLANTLTERPWFPDAWSMDRLNQELQELGKR